MEFRPRNDFCLFVTLTIRTVGRPLRMRQYHKIPMAEKTLPHIQYLLLQLLTGFSRMNKSQCLLKSLIGMICGLNG